MRTRSLPFALAALLTLSLGFSGLPVPVAAAAVAALQVEEAVGYTAVAASAPGDSGVPYVVGADGTRREPAEHRVPTGLLSPDATLIAWAAPNGSEQDSGATLYVAAPHGSARRAVAGTVAGELGISGLDWAPDSRNLLVTVAMAFGTRGAPARDTLFVAHTDGTAPTPVPHTAGLETATYFPNDVSRILARGAKGLVTLTIGQSPAEVPGTEAASNGAPRVSPDGTRVAFARMLKTGKDTYSNDLVVQGLDGSGQQVLPEVESGPVWSRDGSALYVTRTEGVRDGLITDADVWRQPLDESPAIRLTHTPAVHETGPLSVLSRPARDLAPTQVSAELDGARPRVSWTPPGEGTIRVEVKRSRVDAPAQQTLVYSGTATGFTDFAPLVNDDYLYEVVAIDAAGARRGSSRTAVTTLTPARFSMPSASSGLSAELSPLVQFAGNDAGATAQYQGEWARRGADGSLGPWQSWFSPTGGIGLGFGPTTPTRVVPGDVFAFRVKEFDAYGNEAAWVTSRDLVVPLDESAARFSGSWRRSSGSAARDRWLGTLRTSLRPGRTATLAFTARSLRVIGDRCPTCGRFAVLLDGHRVATVGTGSRTLRTRQVLWSSARLPAGRHVLRLVTLSTPGHPRVALDGFAVSR